MSAPVNTGGPAFPRAHESNRAEDRGMSLRDYAAIEAMKGFLGGHVAHYGHENHWRFQDMADEAYAVADAMLVAREKGGAA